MAQLRGAAFCLRGPFAEWRYRTNVKRAEVRQSELSRMSRRKTVARAAVAQIQSVRITCLMLSGAAFGIALATALARANGLIG
jgi:hypothetical protein